MSPSLRGAQELLGTPQARFHMHWPWFVWVGVWATPVIVMVLALVAGDVGIAIALGVVISLVACLPLTWFLRRHQLVLTDRALVMGAFVPGTSLDVLFYADVDAPTLRTWSNLCAYLRSSGLSAFSSGEMITPGSRTGMTVRVRRAGRLRGGKLVENELVAAIGGAVEMFALSGSAERFVQALTSLLRAAGVPGAADAAQRALPPGRLSGERDSHRTEIPGWPAPYAPDADGAEAGSLPPEIERILRERHEKR